MADFYTKRKGFSFNLGLELSVESNLWVSLHPKPEHCISFLNQHLMKGAPAFGRFYPQKSITLFRVNSTSILAGKGQNGDTNRRYLFISRTLIRVSISYQYIDYQYFNHLINYKTRSLLPCSCLSTVGNEGQRSLDFCPEIKSIIFITR